LSSPPPIVAVLFIIIVVVITTATVVVITTVIVVIVATVVIGEVEAVAAAVLAHNRGRAARTNKVPYNPQTLVAREEAAVTAAAVAATAQQARGGRAVAAAAVAAAALSFSPSATPVPYSQPHGFDDDDEVLLPFVPSTLHPAFPAYSSDAVLPQWRSPMQNYY
jgi:hypothetical protein